MVDLIATQISRKLPMFYSLYREPESSGINALTPNWDSLFGYAYPPIALLPRVLRKIRLHPTAEVILVAPFWPSQIWFHPLTQMLVDFPRKLPDKWNLLKNSETGELYPEPSKLRLVAQGFSEAVAKLASCGKRPSTYRVYDSCLAHYSRWCTSRSLDPCSAPVQHVAEFLSDLAKITKPNPLSYNTIIGYRTAIGAIHTGFPGGVTVSNHPALHSVMKGIFNSKATTSRLKPVWDLPKVLGHLSQAPYAPMARASLRNLSVKTAFLIQLASG